MKKIVGIENQVNAKRIPDQLCMQRVAEVIDQGMLEIPNIPDKGRFIEGPLRNAGHMRGDLGNERPSQDQAQECIKRKHEKVAMFHQKRLQVGHKFRIMNSGCVSITQPV